MSSQPINPLDILVQLDWAEGDDLEFKSAQGGLPKSLWETYSAMANSHGRVILLGVEHDGRVSGVREPRKLKEGQGRWSRYRLPEASHSVHKVGGLRSYGGRLLT